MISVTDLRNGWPAMTTAILDAKTREFDVEDMEYSVTATSRCSRAYSSRAGRGRSGAGRVPWRRLVPERPDTEKLRHHCDGDARHRVDRARFPFGNEDPYPARSLTSTMRVRWTKLNAHALKTRPELVGLSGQSSGGHLAMLVAMRPH